MILFPANLHFLILSSAFRHFLNPLSSPVALYTFNSRPVFVRQRVVSIWIHPVHEALATASLPGLPWLYNICSKS